MQEQPVKIFNADLSGLLRMAKNINEVIFNLFALFSYLVVSAAGVTRGNERSETIFGANRGVFHKIAVAVHVTRLSHIISVKLYNKN